MPVDHDTRCQMDIWRLSLMTHSLCLIVVFIFYSTRNTKHHPDLVVKLLWIFANCPYCIYSQYSSCLNELGINHNQSTQHPTCRGNAKCYCMYRDDCIS